jgi:putative GTP pyrophosphokinase
VAPDDLSTLTISQVNKAGRSLRRWLRGVLNNDSPTIDEALQVVERYRAAHAYALTKATMGLRSVVRTEQCELQVSQRLKRMTTILDKLVREPTMQLASMQDIGGCRAVLASIPDLRRVEHRLRKNRPPLRYSDYVKGPRASGYRAVHVVVGYHDEFSNLRAVEVQLRTKVMHEWAITVERLSGRLRDDLKSGRGPESVLTLMAAISEAMALEERNETVPDSLIVDIGRLRSAAMPYLRGVHG